VSDPSHPSHAVRVPGERTGDPGELAEEERERSLVREQSESKFLEGPRGRLEELARVARISAELVRGFRELAFVGPCVTVFGSARFPEEHRYYAQARDVGARLARAGFTVMTGGGPGIM
jgi:hypothetical protein